MDSMPRGILWGGISWSPPILNALRPWDKRPEDQCSESSPENEHRSQGTGPGPQEKAGARDPGPGAPPELVPLLPGSGLTGKSWDSPQPGHSFTGRCISETAGAWLWLSPLKPSGAVRQLEQGQPAPHPVPRPPCCRPVPCQRAGLPTSRS